MSTFVFLCLSHFKSNILVSFPSLIPRLWLGRSIIYHSQFCWLCILSNYWSMWQEQFFWDFYFSIKLFTSRSLITWSYALNVFGFCSSHLKSNFRSPRLPDLLWFRGTLFLSPHKTCLVPATLTRFSQAFVWNFLHIIITT